MLNCPFKNSPPHNIYAYKLRQKDNVLEHYDDDKEWGAGRNLLSLLQQKDITNQLIVVTCWYGGSYIGPTRFQLIKRQRPQHCSYSKHLKDNKYFVF